MKRLVFCSLLLPCLANAQETPFQVKGKVGTLNAPATVYIRYAANDQTVMDSAVLQNGSFAFSGKIQAPVRATLTLYPQGKASAGNMAPDMLQVYLEKEVLNLASADSLKKAVVKGGKVNQDYQLLKDALKPSNDKSKALMDGFYALPEDKRNDKALNEELGKKFDAIDAEQNAAKKAFIQSHPASFISLETLKTYGGYYPDYKEVEGLFQALQPALKNSVAGKAFTEKLAIMRQTSIGSVAPNFTQNDPDGKPVSLASFRGKYVLIDFWASWCGPCRAENPNVVKTYQQFKDRNFTILGVSLDQPGAREKWVKAIADDHLDWTQVSDLKYWNNEVAKAYGIVAIPMNFLLDPSGKIIARNLRSEALQQKLTELIQ